MQLFIALNGSDISEFVYLPATQIQKDSTNAVSTARLTIFAEHEGREPLYDDAIFDESYFSIEPKEWDGVVVTDENGTRQFGGFITAITRKGDPGKPVTFECICSDYGILLARSIVAPQTWTNTSDHAIILAACAGITGITVASGDVATIVANLATVEAKDISARAVLENVCNLTGGEWRVDYSGALHYYQAGVAAPWNVSDTPDDVTTFAVRVDSLKTIAPDANRITVLGGMGAAAVEIKATVNDTAAQAKYGILSATVVDRQLANTASATLRANAEVANRAWPIISGDFTTFKDGLDVGQSVSIKNESYALNAAYLIRAIGISQRSNDVTQYKVTFGQRIPNQELILRRTIQAARQTGYMPPAELGTGQVNDSNLDRTSVNKIKITNADIDRATVNKLKVTDADITSLSVDKLTGGTITATVKMTSPEIVITGTPAITIKAGVFKVAAGGMTTDLSAGYVEVSNGSAYTQVNDNGVYVTTGSASAQLAAAGVTLNGSRVLTVRQAGVGDAPVSYSTASFSDVNAALTTLGQKINLILDRIGSAGHGLTAD